MKQENEDWREFEEAVAAFATAMDPSATVRHDFKSPDRHTGRPRQRDVWIEAKVCQLFPVSVLVSCKRWKRKLHSGDIDAFHGELLSSHAHVGVVYSYSGFTKPAIEKAKELDISCCMLYRGQPAEVPDSLLFTAYCTGSRIGLSLSPLPARGWSLDTWNDLFNLEGGSQDATKGLLDEIVNCIQQAENAALRALRNEGEIPKPFTAKITISSSDPDAISLRVVVTGMWKFYRAKVDAYLLNGSYSLTSGEFKGQIATPWLDLSSTNPGPGWEPLDEAPDDLTNTVMLVPYGPDAERLLRESLGPQKIEDAH